MEHIRQPISTWPASDRPREQLLQSGPHSLSEASLMAILLRSGNRILNAVDLARSVLAQAGHVARLARCTPAQLRTMGLGPAQAAALSAAFELGRRVEAAQEEEAPVIDNPDKVALRMGPMLRDLQHEEFWVLFLNSANRLQGQSRISVGTLNASLAHPRECFAEAVAKRAGSVIFVHNHPSGNGEPSREDIALTRQLVESGRVLGIPVHDHIIIAGRSHTSLAERGLMS